MPPKFDKEKNRNSAHSVVSSYTKIISYHIVNSTNIQPRAIFEKYAEANIYLYYKAFDLKRLILRTNSEDKNINTTSHYFHSYALIWLCDR